MINNRKDTVERHECRVISGKAVCILLDRTGTPSCIFCRKELLWSQIDEKLHNRMRTQEVYKR